ncbi:hypothetical protein DSO57_1005025 [Entomophthora muscae]|uniref:Uncharacterized protein n=2 Tax=Entomophthora muscae TaxID=34485 RepID=A0ACC2TIN7_9FUNG|nr:hypothetical protein DSO57_1005025 [Entomophthora muscae]
MKEKSIAKINIKPMAIPTRRGSNYSELSHKLSYSIHSWSSHSANFHPNNVLVDEPKNQASRWSTDSNKQTQFLMLELEKLSIVQHITFGKYEKNHVCNLKELKVYGGVNTGDMEELLNDGLRNDTIPETFSLKHTYKNGAFPCKFIKIVPLAAFGPSFNFSIWYVQLQGIDDAEVINIAHKEFNLYREKEAIRLCLKYFRQRNYVDVFQALERQSGMELEDPQLTDFYRVLVEEGDFEAVEETIIQASSQGYFQEYCSRLPYKPQWKRIYACDSNGVSPVPRGGHQMCLNVPQGIIYVLGGWDGYQDLSDFWEYNISQQCWNQISEDTRRQGGPGPRSCFKTCFDPINLRMYVLGRYLSSRAACDVNLEADFYCYDIKTQCWTELSSDTKAENGPGLIFDHQMCIDPESQTIYVSGGRQIHPDSSIIIYSGLYSYDIKRHNWTLLKPTSPYPAGEGVSLEGRISHSMVFDSATRQLYVLAGERNKDFLSDIFSYDIEKNTIGIYRDYTHAGGPHPGFAQPATLDPERQEIYVMSGMTREKGATVSTVKNMVWVYNIEMDMWSEVYQNDSLDPDYWAQMGDREPHPRFAHQMVYDHNSKVHYMFGGNPSNSIEEKRRLEDFWELRLTRGGDTDVLRQAKLMIRKHKFFELCSGQHSPLKALTYLRLQVAELVDHSCPRELAEFHALASSIFTKKIPEPALQFAVAESPFFTCRVQLYEDLIAFFPETMKQPSGNLIELIRLK